MLLLVWMLGCNNKEMEAENARLQLRVADLERANSRLTQENTVLKERMARADAQAAEAAHGHGEEGPGGSTRVIFHTSLGDIHCTLRDKEAPLTVQNFLGLARGTKEWTDPSTNAKVKKPLYDGTIFHRVIPEFMIQGGDPLGNGMGGPGYTFEDEVGHGSAFDRPGLLAMANAGPNTNGSQFFITEGTPTYLNGKHTIFGDCSDLELVKQIARVPRDGNDKPNTPVVLKSVEIP